MVATTTLHQPAVYFTKLSPTEALLKSVRSHLAEQHFWAHPPPYVDEDSRPPLADRPVERLDEAFYVWVLRSGDRAGLDAGLELYRRYKYGPMERKYFRNRSRRLAAKAMVALWLRVRADAGSGASSEVA